MLASISADDKAIQCPDPEGPVTQKVPVRHEPQEPLVRRDLVYNQNDCDANQTPQQCCSCHASSTLVQTATPLYIELVSVDGTNLLLPPSPSIEGNTSYSIHYSNNNIKEFPSNFCQTKYKPSMGKHFVDQFKEVGRFVAHIVKVDFSHNAIREVPDLNCLRQLDSLDLSYNSITALSNTSFSELSYLRLLYLQHNSIQHMQPNILSAPRLSLQHVDLSNNDLKQLDVTNIFSKKPFCSIHYQNNKIEELVNESGFKLDQENTHGRLKIYNNNIQTFPDFKELFHLDHLNELGKLLDIAIAFGPLPVTCDCHLAPFMGLTSETINSLCHGCKNLVCAKPESLKNMRVSEFLNNQDKLVCDLKGQPGCEKCSCIDQPSQNRIIVNCSGLDLTEMPKVLPHSKFSKNVSLDLSNNAITELKNISYLSNLSYLSLDGNNVGTVDNEAAYQLENAQLDLSNNPNLQRLPSVLRYSSSVRLANNIITCDCDSSWIADWNTNHTAAANASFLCQVPGHGLISPDNFTRAMLDCDVAIDSLLVYSILLSVVAVLLVIIGLLSYCFRYEILILMVRAKQAHRNKVRPIIAHDAYLSFDEENDDLRQWVNMRLVPHLERSVYKVFVPLRDLPLGDVCDVSIIESLNKTRNFVLLLSESYMTNTRDGCWLEHEWKYGWHLFKANRDRNIVMINFDHLLASEISNPQIKAFLRVGGPVEFDNTKGNILQKICDKLGPATAKYEQHAKVWFNRKKVLCTKQLFLANAIKADMAKQKRNNERCETGRDGNIYCIDNMEDKTNSMNDDDDPDAADNDDDSINIIIHPEPFKNDFHVHEQARPAYGMFKYYV